MCFLSQLVTLLGLSRFFQSFLADPNLKLFYVSRQYLTNCVKLSKDVHWDDVKNLFDKLEKLT